MKRSLLFMTLLSSLGMACAQDCDCSAYPFKPNPPCFGHCVSKLSAEPPSATEDVKNIDPGVAVGIGVLSQSKVRSAVDFKAIQGKQDLERAALKSMKAPRNMKSEALAKPD